MSRRHRWIRGDWQIAGWLLPRVPGAAGKRRPNTLSALAWWKIFDNLRRSLVPPALLLLLVGGWTLAPEPTGFWTLFVLALLVGRCCAPRCWSWSANPENAPGSCIWTTAAEIAGPPAGADRPGIGHLAVPRRHPSGCDSGLRRAHAVHAARTVALAHARVCTAQRRRHARRFPAGNVGRALVRRGRAGRAGADASRRNWHSAGRYCCLWLLRAVRRLVDQPAPRAGGARAVGTRSGRSCARSPAGRGATSRCWSTRRRTGCRRTISRKSPNPSSPRAPRRPTSGWRCWPIWRRTTSATSPAASCSSGPTTPSRQWRNWSATAAISTTGTTRARCSPLRPLYVSSVDSGNLLGALFTLRAGLLELKHQPLVSDRTRAGLGDTLHVLRDQVRGSPALLAGVQRAQAILDAPNDETVDAIVARLQELAEEAAGITREVSAHAPGDLQWWAQRFRAPVPRRTGRRAGPRSRAAAVRDRCRPCRSWRRAPSRGDRAAERIRQIDDLAQRCTELAEMDFSFLYDPACDLLSDRLQRHRPAPRSFVLRPARLGGAAGEFHSHRPGPVAAGTLVRPGPPGRPPTTARWRCCRGAARCSST